MGITVAGYAYQHFVAKLKQLKKENDPIEAMNRLKPVFYRTFETQFSGVQMAKQLLTIFGAFYESQLKRH